MKVAAVKFQHVDQRTIRGRIGHTRTGACTCRRNQRCCHGMRPIARRSGSKAKKSKI